VHAKYKYLVGNIQDSIDISMLNEKTIISTVDIK